MRVSPAAGGTFLEALAPGRGTRVSTVGELGERALLERLRARIEATPDVLVGPGDDAALLRTGPQTLVTTDTLVEGVHFHRAWSSPRRLGRKALSVNLSDIAAMAGRGRHATVSLCLPPTLDVSWLDGLYDGLLQRAAETGVALVGGNLSGIAGPVVIDVALLGESARPLLRRGARAGDSMVVTGTLGDAAAGLALLEGGLRLAADDSLELPATAPHPGRREEEALRACLRAHLDPAPPLDLAAALAAVEGVHAGMDLSDGLSSDLRVLCAESAVSAAVRPDLLPVLAPGLAAWGVGDALRQALHGGEDYQLLLAVDPAQLDALHELARAHAVRLTAIGVFEAGPPRLWLEGAGGREPLPPRGHEHFRPRPGALP